MLCPARNKTNVLKRSVLLIACQPLKTCVRVSFAFSIPVFKNKHKRIGISIYVPMKKSIQRQFSRYVKSRVGLLSPVQLSETNEVFQ